MELQSSHFTFLTPKFLKIEVWEREPLLFERADARDTGLTKPWQLSYLLTKTINTPVLLHDNYEASLEQCRGMTIT